MQRMELLEQVAAAVKAKDDKALLLAWDDLLFRDYKRAQAYAPQVAEARAHLANVHTLKAALEEGNDKLIMLLWDNLKLARCRGARHTRRLCAPAKSAGWPHAHREASLGPSTRGN